MQRLLYIIEALVNVRKLFQIKRYAVIFFDMKALPEDGATITVGKMQAVFHPIDASEPVVDEDVAELESAMMDSMQLKEKDEEEPLEHWECKKCKTNQDIQKGDILQCVKCGFRTTKG